MTRLAVERTRVDGICPECGADALAAYPVLSEHGWEDVVKCQSCLCSVSRSPGPRLGPIRLLSDTLERAEGS
jgi:vanillate/4-hydroxybenzoate decarboxylase subunit D